MIEITGSGHRPAKSDVPTSYRPDITGLRAVAVLPILLFHAGLNVLAGGFVGVDIFFVISGFLITGIIVRDLEQDRFSLMEFYRRRVARIFPALIVVLVATLLAAAAWMLPTEIHDLGLSAGAAAAFVSNFHFLMSTDYFGGAAESKPLLHTWSLAVEEQFYVFYPFLLIAIWKWARKFLVHSVFLLCLISFALALVFNQIRPEASFYMLPTRAWELGIGALVALGAYPKIRSERIQNTLSLIGLMMIVIAIIIIRPNSYFPAPAALIPTIGAALLIAYGRKGYTSNILSSRAFMWIGNISYSLYLCHWPIITFYRLQTGIELTLYETTFLVAASIAAAAITQILVEEPFRKRLVQQPRSAVIASGIGSIFLVIGLSLASAHKPTSFQRLPSKVFQLTSVADYNKTADYRYQFRKGICFMGEADRQTFNKDCLKIDHEKENWVIFGDSHAAQYWRAFSEFWPDRNVVQATASGCRPLVNTKGPDRCTSMVKYVIDEILIPTRIDSVIFAGRWRKEEVSSLVSTVSLIKSRGLPVVVIGPTVEYDGDFPLLLARAELSGSEDDVRKRQLADRQALDRTLRPRIEAAGATYISQFETECPEGRCLFLDDADKPIHFDYGHLTLSGSRKILAGFANKIESADKHLTHYFTPS